MSLRHNTYLTSLNNILFKPQGLYAMIVTRKPDMPLQSEADMSKNVTQPASQLTTNSRGSGQMSSEEEHLLECAALIYPELEKSNVEPSPLASKDGMVKTFKGNLPRKRGRSSGGKPDKQQSEVADLNKERLFLGPKSVGSVRRKLHEVSITISES